MGGFAGRIEGARKRMLMQDRDIPRVYSVTRGNSTWEAASQQQHNRMGACMDVIDSSEHKLLPENRRRTYCTIVKGARQRMCSIQKEHNIVETSGESE